MNENEIEHDDSDDFEATPWLYFYDETPGIIRHSEGSETRIYFIMALLFLGVAYYIFGAMPFDDPRDDVFVYGVRSIFPFIAALCLFHGIRGSLHKKKFGVSTLKVNHLTGRLGGELSGTIQTSVELQPQKDYVITVECTKKSVSEGAERSRSHYTSLWKDSCSVGYAAASSRSGISFHFKIPSSLPPSNFIGGDGHINWTVTIKAALSGLDYKAVFSIPVFK